MIRISHLLLSLLCALIFLSGCCQKSPSGGRDSETVVSINNYNISRDEFEKEFKESTYGKSDTAESRQAFLDSFIDRKLILQYAQAEELDKEKGFLKMIERFWEQSLLKIALDKKTKEIESKISASGWEARRAEEARMMNEWINGLRAKAHIKVKEGILKGKADKGGR